MKLFFAIRSKTETESIYDFVDLPGCVSITKIADEIFPGSHITGFSNACFALEKWLSENALPASLRTKEQLREHFPDAVIQDFDMLEDHEIRAREEEQKRFWHENGKRRGGTIKNWQIHKMSSFPGNMSKEKYLEFYPDTLLAPYPLMFTGTIVEEPTGRIVGNHMRSSVIVRIDRESGEIETLNSVYKMELTSEFGDIFDDLGNDVLNVFY
jgi:hypothetical protein